jgi:hypothetical protein
MEYRLDPVVSRIANGDHEMTEALKQNGGRTVVGDLIPAKTLKTPATTGARDKKRHFYKLLPKEFRRHGFNYRYIAREGEAAIYLQTWVSCAEPSPAYEVIRIRCREGFQIGGRFVEPAEVYPPSESWGVNGFTLTDRNKAWAKFSEISLKKPATRERR